MKDLSTFIKESIINEGCKEGSFIKFTLFGDNASAKASIAALAQKAGVYFENIDNGFKLKVKEGQNVHEIAATIQKLIDDIPEDKKEEYAEAAMKLQSAIDKMNAAAEVSAGPRTEEE